MSARTSLAIRGCAFGVGCCVLLAARAASSQEAPAPKVITPPGAPAVVAPRPQGGFRSQDWRSTVRSTLPRFGHRNWIVIADAAYPAQNSEGITTIVTRADHLEVLKFIREELARQSHLRPVAYLDAELPAVPATDAPGIDELRGQLLSIVAPWEPQMRPHEAILDQLATASKNYQVLVLKTNLTLPYTSVFLQLDCGYWSPAAEERLRAVLQKSGDRK